MEPGRDQTRDHWICSQTGICSWTRYQLHYAARYASSYGSFSLTLTMREGGNLISIALALFWRKQSISIVMHCFVLIKFVQQESTYASTSDFGT